LLLWKMSNTHSIIMA